MQFNSRDSGAVPERNPQLPDGLLVTARGKKIAFASMDGGGYPRKAVANTDGM